MEAHATAQPAGTMPTTTGMMNALDGFNGRIANIEAEMQANASRMTMYHQGFTQELEATRTKVREEVVGVTTGAVATEMNLINQWGEIQKLQAEVTNIKAGVSDVVTHLAEEVDGKMQAVASGPVVEALVSQLAARAQAVEDR